LFSFSQPSSVFIGSLVSTEKPKFHKSPYKECSQSHF
jgi:hypothetical protein